MAKYILILGKLKLNIENFNRTKAVIDAFDLKIFVCLIFQIIILKEFLSRQHISLYFQIKIYNEVIDLD